MARPGPCDAPQSRSPIPNSIRLAVLSKSETGAVFPVTANLSVRPELLLSLKIQVAEPCFVPSLPKAGFKHSMKPERINSIN